GRAGPVVSLPPGDNVARDPASAPDLRWGLCGLGAGGDRGRHARAAQVSSPSRATRAGPGPRSVNDIAEAPGDTLVGTSAMPSLVCSAWPGRVSQGLPHGAVAVPSASPAKR